MTDPDVRALRNAVLHLIFTSNNVEHEIGIQLEEIDKISQLVTELSQGSQNPVWDEMNGHLQAARHSIEEAIAAVNEAVGKARRYIGVL